MNGFLKQVATHLFDKYQGNPDRVTLVFPNRRGGVFFTNYLNNLVTTPLISPEITTINELYSELSSLHIPDRLSLVFRLYKVYCESTRSTELFDDFYFWGEMLIGDFDQVDKYLVDAHELFTNVTELKEIDDRFSDLHEEEKERLGNFWKTLADKVKSPNQQEFIRIWEDIYGVYSRFKALLLGEGLAYEGMLYREVTEKIILKNESSLGDRRFAFIGFNALNRCEETLFDHLQNLGKASFYWDFDNYYVEDQTQEAGYFLRKNMARFPHDGFYPDSESLTSRVKNIKIVNIPSQVGQAQVASNELYERFSGEMNFDETAVVLCDEELLIPMLNALPETSHKVNITMGYPLKMTPVYSLIALLIALQKNGRNSVDGFSFYNKDVLSVLNHQMIIDFEPSGCRELVGRILANNSIYLSDKELATKPIFQRLFGSPSGILELSEYFLELVKLIFLHWQSRKGGDGEPAGTSAQNDQQTDVNSALFSEYLYQSYLAINKLKDILVNDGIKVFESSDYVSKEAFFRFLLQYLGSVSIPFEGEPLEGLQVMGILETRTLDFKNLIILSMNDGIMPKISSTGSFIPYNLRRVFGLPAIEEQNAMYAYYFYRLLQRSQNVTFVYDSGANGMFTGEQSRYLYQLQFESQFPITRTNMVYNIENIAVQPISIVKDAKVMERLSDYLNGTRPLSPSAIDKYLTCPLMFYFRYPAGIAEPDEIAEEVDALIFGQLFHYSMEHLYGPYIGKQVKAEDIELIIHNQELIRKVISSSFSAVYFKDDQKSGEVSITGRNWLIFEVVLKYINQLLAVDLKRTPFEIAGLEKKVSALFGINDFTQYVLLGGTIDRVDRIDDSIYILDYKTGITDLSFPVLASLFEKENKNRNKAAFQTLVYSCILHRNQPEIKAMFPGIYSLRGIFESDFNPSLLSKETGNTPVEFNAVSGVFESHLRDLIEEIFNADIPFTQTTIGENCKNCPYRQICRR